MVKLHVLNNIEVEKARHTAQRTLDVMTTFLSVFGSSTSTQFEAKQAESREHISNLDLDLDFINGQYDYDVNLSISPIKMLYSNVLPYRSLRLQPCAFVRVCMNLERSENQHEE